MMGLLSRTSTLVFIMGGFCLGFSWEATGDAAGGYALLAVIFCVLGIFKSVQEDDDQ